MALLEQENGSIKFSAKEYNKAKKQLIEDNNYWLERCQYVAERCFSHLQENIDEYRSRSKNTFVKNNLTFDEHGSLIQVTPNESQYEQSNKFMNFIITEIIKNAMYTTGHNGEIISRNHKVDILDEGAKFVKSVLLKTNQDGFHYIKKPEKSDFPFANIHDNIISFQNGTIEFNDDNKTIGWDVPQANNAVKEAWQSRAGISLSNTLNNVSEWKESTGGLFYYKNEKDESAKLSKTLGPIGQDEFNKRIQAMKNKIKPK